MEILPGATVVRETATVELVPVVRGASVVPVPPTTNDEDVDAPGHPPAGAGMMSPE